MGRWVSVLQEPLSPCAGHSPPCSRFPGFGSLPGPNHSIAHFRQKRNSGFLFRTGCSFKTQPAFRFRRLPASSAYWAKTKRRPVKLLQQPQLQRALKMDFLHPSAASCLPPYRMSASLLFGFVGLPPRPMDPAFRRGAAPPGARGGRPFALHTDGSVKPGYSKSSCPTYFSNPMYSARNKTIAPRLLLEVPIPFITA